MPALIAAATLAVVGGTAVSSSAASRSTQVAVVRCPTTYGISGEQRQTPPSVAVLGRPASTHGLVAYTNTFDYLIGPAGMQCAGVVAVDGGTLIAVWPKGDPKPVEHAHEAGLTLALDPACVGCKEDDACPFFSQFAVQEQLSCPNGGIPPGEDAYGLTKNTTLFEDPPGVAGDGWPSGGSDPANGVVGVNVAEQSLVYRSTCTLPSVQHSICTVVLNDVIARYG